MYKIILKPFGVQFLKKLEKNWPILQAMPWSLEDWQFFEWCLYETCHTITIGFVCFIIKPLWTLAKGRPVLFFVFSKSILSLIDTIGTLLARTANRVKWDVLEATLFIWRLEFKLMHDILAFAINLNIMALAFNRMHCIMWPFHYNGWISKKKIIVQCVLIWILGMLIAIGLHIKDGDNRNSYKASTYILYITIGIYLIVGAKLAWKKYSSDELTQSAAEKDFNKITIVCLSGLLLILISYTAQAVVLMSDRKDLILNLSMQIIQYILGVLLYCADELCLIVLLADFRRIIKKLLLSFSGRWTNYYGNDNSSQNAINIMMVPISKGGMPPISQ